MLGVGGAEKMIGLGVLEGGAVGKEGYVLVVGFGWRGGELWVLRKGRIWRLEKILSSEL